MGRRFAFLVMAGVPLFALVTSSACSSANDATPVAASPDAGMFAQSGDDSEGDGATTGDGDAKPKRVRLDGALHPDASCMVTIETPLLLAHHHVPIGTTVQYNSNPPSSGDHYPIWAAYQSFPVAVDRRYYVHDLEHGAIVLAYKCDNPAGCPEIAAQLQKIADALHDDPGCVGTGVRAKFVITPDPLLDVPIAAAAWGWTYKAQCVDLPTLQEFARARYGQGTESTCENGQTSF